MATLRWICVSAEHYSFTGARFHVSLLSIQDKLHVNVFFLLKSNLMKLKLFEVEGVHPSTPLFLDWSAYGDYDPFDPKYGSTINPFLVRRTSADSTPRKLARCSVKVYERFIACLGPDGKLFPPVKNEERPCGICFSFFHYEKKCAWRIYSKTETPISLNVLNDWWNLRSRC